MANLLLVVYLLIVLAMIAVILLQRSEGGGLGMGSSGGAGGLMSARGSANLLTRTTAILAALFMATAIAMSILAGHDGSTDSILDAAAQGDGAAPVSVLDALNQLQGDEDLPVPQSSAQDGAAAPAADTETPAAQQDGSAGGEMSLPVPEATPGAGN